MEDKAAYIMLFGGCVLRTFRLNCLPTHTGKKQVLEAEYYVSHRFSDLFLLQFSGDGTGSSSCSLQLPCFLLPELPTAWTLLNHIWPFPSPWLPFLTISLTDAITGGSKTPWVVIFPCFQVPRVYVSKDKQSFKMVPFHSSQHWRSQRMPFFTKVNLPQQCSHCKTKYPH